MSWPWVVLLALGIAVVVAAEWPRVAGVADARRARERKRRKAELTVIPGGENDDDFARSVQADLDALPTIDEPRPTRPTSD